ncbi:hypothetical protein KAFR_0L00510 [Kazachstania africana CBS 2517]|uniref:BZIP domain-containing protein n=1 Tax=Kazachstania africana (strain ATCC 22294 / BCRC 22015 / CBS 2517 / CECT 1963 / NBRC 1671 / NRRL Y-8276) TaxID=1071382 RepID=H2B208_KAZAF|nr:hypothetical protein KAFR_0L00510 [Kazachstania africana CBS 2517]CCF60658.1 hypothetical protein KAFR_0L00510 [Kazachstania africana CBS 2517]
MPQYNILTLQEQLSIVSDAKTLNEPSFEVIPDFSFQISNIKEDDSNNTINDDYFNLNSNSTELDADLVETFFSSSVDSTPMFDLDESLQTSTSSDPNTWTSLFDDDIPVVTEEDVTNNDDAIKITDDVAQVKQEETASFLPTPAIEQETLSKATKITTGRVSKKVSNPKVDHLGVVSYNRKARAAPLTPVIADPSDPVALKRARNTEAARRSRARKLQRMNQLETKVENLISENSDLQNEVARLRSLLESNGVSF